MLPVSIRYEVIDTRRAEAVDRVLDELEARALPNDDNDLTVIHSPILALGRQEISV